MLIFLISFFVQILLLLIICFVLENILNYLCCYFYIILINYFLIMFISLSSNLKAQTLLFIKANHTIKLINRFPNFYYLFKNL